MSEQEKKQAGKGFLVTGIFVIVVVAVLVGMIVFLVTSKKTLKERTASETEVNEKRAVLVTEDNVEEVVEEIIEQEEAEKNAPGYYTVTMDTTWHFATGSEPSYDAVVINSEQNTNDVYFDIVMRDDDSQLLYSSPVIPLGGRLDNIRLDKDLEPGTYKTLVKYNLVDDEQNFLSSVVVGLTIIVEG